MEFFTASREIGPSLISPYIQQSMSIEAPPEAVSGVEVLVKVKVAPAFPAKFQTMEDSKFVYIPPIPTFSQMSPSGAKNMLTLSSVRNPKLKAEKTLTSIHY